MLNAVKLGTTCSTIGTKSAKKNFVGHILQSIQAISRLLVQDISGGLSIHYLFITPWYDRLGLECLEKFAKFDVEFPDSTALLHVILMGVMAVLTSFAKSPL